MIRAAVMAIVLCSATLNLAQANDRVPRMPHVPIPANGYVPDESIAIRVGEAVLSGIFGSEQIDKEKPFKAVLIKGAWYVYGSAPKGMMGGVAIIKISKRTGCILAVAHPR